MEISSKSSNQNLHVLVDHRKDGSKDLLSDESIFHGIEYPIPPVSGCVIVDNPDIKDLIDKFYEIFIHKSKLVLEKTHLFANIENSLAEIHFTTEYKNSSDHPIELLYQFPTDQRFTVTRVKAVIDDREILTKIMEKEEAKETYSDAVASGNTAVKVSFDEEVADILNINIG